MVLQKSVSPHSCVLYADDVLLHRGISQPKEDLLTVQSEIDELEKWSEEQFLQIQANASI